MTEAYGYYTYGDEKDKYIIGSSSYGFYKLDRSLYLLSKSAINYTKTLDKDLDNNLLYTFVSKNAVCYDYSLNKSANVYDSSFKLIPVKKYKEKSAYCTNTNQVPLEYSENERSQVLSKTVYTCNIKAGLNENFICPVNKTAKTYGTVIPKTTSFKGPNKTAYVENVSSDPSVGQGTGTLNEIRLKLAIHQFITLKVDIPGAKINNLPDGFTFANSEITGAAKNPGEYRFNIISENTSVPVIMNVSNIIRIS